MKIIFYFPKEAQWQWVDGTRMNTPADSWHFWYPGQPDNANDNEDCVIMTNYLFWKVRKKTIEDYLWLDYNCAINPQEIQGYICESKHMFPPVLVPERNEIRK